MGLLIFDEVHKAAQRAVNPTSLQALSPHLSPPHCQEMDVSMIPGSVTKATDGQSFGSCEEVFFTRDRL